MPIQPNQIAKKPNPIAAQPAPPATGAGFGAFYAKDVGAGQVEGFFVDESGISTQITDNGEVLGGGGGGSGEVNTASNVGTGEGSVYKTKTGVDFKLRTIKAGANVTVTQGTDEITIAAPGGGGGEDGADGADGADGSVILTGSGTPSIGLGKNTDLYINTVNSDYYLKSAGSWALQGNLKGANGSNGSNGADGDDGTNGIDGDDGADGIGVPAGGTTGQVMAKASDDDFDTEWVDASEGGGADISEYTASAVSGDECVVRATGTGITYSRTGTTGTFVIPGGVKLLSFMLRTPAAMASATFTLIHSQGTNSEALGFPPIFSVWNDGVSKTLRATANASITDPNYDRLAFSGLATTAGHRIRGSF